MSRRHLQGLIAIILAGLWGFNVYFAHSQGRLRSLDRAEAAIFEVAERRVADTLVALYPALEQTMNQLEALYDRQGDIVGTATGYRDLDSLLLGMQPSTLTVVAARPGQGKTSLALGMAQHVALQGRKPRPTPADTVRPSRPPFEDGLAGRSPALHAQRTGPGHASQRSAPGN